MPTPGQAMTLRDLALLYGDNGRPDVLIDMVANTHSVTEDIAWKEGNQTEGHKFRVIEGLPGVSYRSINEGVKPTRSTQNVVVETCSLLEAVSEIDKELVDLSSNAALFRMEESQAFVEGMMQRVAKEVWYGNRVSDPRGIMGLSERYNSLTGPAHRQIIDARDASHPAGDSDYASIWLLGHGDYGLHGIYPKGTHAGLEHTGSDLVDLTDPDGGTYQGYRDRFKFRPGLALKDYRQCGRICNIYVPSLSTFGQPGSTAPNLLLLLNRLTNRIQNLSRGNFVLYMNRDLKEAWEMQLLQKQNLALTFDAATGKIVTGYKAIPIKIEDTLLSTEEVVK